MIPPIAITELLAQHAALRDIMDTCDELADELEAGRIEPPRVFEQVARLRFAFTAHARYEAQFLRPVLADSDAFGDVRRLGNTVLDELRETMLRLRRHLDREERFFLSARVVRAGHVECNVLQHDRHT